MINIWVHLGGLPCTRYLKAPSGCPGVTCLSLETSCFFIFLRSKPSDILLWYRMSHLWVTKKDSHLAWVCRRCQKLTGWLWQWYSLCWSPQFGCGPSCRRLYGSCSLGRSGKWHSWDVRNCHTYKDKRTCEPEGQHVRIKHYREQRYNNTFILWNLFSPINNLTPGLSVSSQILDISYTHLTGCGSHTNTERDTHNKTTSGGGGKTKLLLS